MAKPIAKPLASTSAATSNATGHCRLSEIQHLFPATRNADTIPSRHHPPTMSSTALAKETDTMMSDDNNIIVNIPDENDILLGSGHQQSFHPGNIYYRDYIAERKIQYKQLKLNKKGLFCLSIVHHMTRERNNARFLQYDNDRKCWIGVNESVAKQKVMEKIRHSRPGPGVIKRNSHQLSIVKEAGIIKGNTNTHQPAISTGCDTGVDQADTVKSQTTNDHQSTLRPSTSPNKIKMSQPSPRHLCRSSIDRNDHDRTSKKRSPQPNPPRTTTTKAKKHKNNNNHDCGDGDRNQLFQVAHELLLYTVEEIIDHKLEDKTGVPIYKTRWKGYGAADDTWEPSENVASTGHVDRYERRRRQRMLEGEGRGEVGGGVGSSSSSSSSSSQYYRAAVIEYEDGERETVDVRREKFRRHRMNDESDADADDGKYDGSDADGVDDDGISDYLDDNLALLAEKGSRIQILWRHANVYFSCKVISLMPVREEEESKGQGVSSREEGSEEGETFSAGATEQNEMKPTYNGIERGGDETIRRAHDEEAGTSSGGSTRGDASIELQATSMSRFNASTSSFSAEQDSTSKTREVSNSTNPDDVNDASIEEVAKQLYDMAVEYASALAAKDIDQKRFNAVGLNAHEDTSSSDVTLPVDATDSVAMQPTDASVDVSLSPFHTTKQNGDNSSLERSDEDGASAEGVTPACPTPGQVNKIGRWTTEEHSLFLQGLEQHGRYSWKEIAALVKTRTTKQVRERARTYFQRLNDDVTLLMNTSNVAAEKPMDTLDEVTPSSHKQSGTVSTSKAADGNGSATHDVSSRIGQGRAGGIECPSELDVLGGRGGKTNRHAGNIRFRDEANKLRDLFKDDNTSHEGKILLAQELVEKVIEYGGRFLDRGDDGQWHEMCGKNAQKKASKALRENKWN